MNYKEHMEFSAKVYTESDAARNREYSLVFGAFKAGFTQRDILLPNDLIKFINWLDKNTFTVKGVRHLNTDKFHTIPMNTEQLIETYIDNLKNKQDGNH